MLCLGRNFPRLRTDTQSRTAVPATEGKGPIVQTMFAAIAERYDLANHLLSGGLDFFWRNRAARIVRAWRPRRILDLATGSGDLALKIQAVCPEALIVGADFCHPMLRVARRKGVAHLLTADALQLPFADATFDVATVAFGLRNMESWPRALAEMRRILNPGGHVLILDFSVPGPPLCWAYRPYLHYVLPRIAAFLTREKAAYDYLGESIEEFPHGPAMCELILQSGLAEAKCEPLSGGIVSIYTAVRPI